MGKKRHAASFVPGSTEQTLDTAAPASTAAAAAAASAASAPRALYLIVSQSDIVARSQQLHTANSHITERVTLGCMHMHMQKQ